jgi:hypothetical protein
VQSDSGAQDSAAAASSTPEINLTTLSSGIPQTRMAFISGQGTDAWLQSSEDGSLPLSIDTGMSDPETLGSLLAGVQSNVAGGILDGIADAPSQYVTDGTGLRTNDPVSSGSPPSLGIDDSQRTATGMIKPNGS